MRMTVTLIASLLVVSYASIARASNVGRRFPSEKREIVDAKTGLKIVALTTGPSNDMKIYQTHPQWTADRKHIVFRSANRSADGNGQAFAVNVESGEIIQLTDGPGTGTGSLNVAQKSNKLYFFRRINDVANLIELNLDTLLADSEAGTLKSPDQYERVIGQLPTNLRESGGFALDADETVAYVGVKRLDDAPPPSTAPADEGRRRGPRIAQVPSGIRSMDLKTGELKFVIDTPFTMGHVQNNPWVPGEIVYCKETGGDADQRMYTTKADGAGNRPLYVESEIEWITHEAVTGRDEVMFNIMAHQSRLRTRPTGIAVINLRNDEVKLLGQVDVGNGFWHCNGSPDGKWAVGDNFDGDIHLINRENGKITLLSTGHVMRPDHAHPTFSPDSRQILIQSGLLTNGESLDLILIPVTEETKGNTP